MAPFFNEIRRETEVEYRPVIAFLPVEPTLGDILSHQYWIPDNKSVRDIAIREKLKN